MVSVSVVVVGWEEGNTLDSHFSDLESLDIPQETELIAVVGGTDETYEQYNKWANEQDQFETVNILQQNLDDGISGAVNRGLRAANGEFFLYLEVDTTISSNWLTSMLSVLDEYEAASADFRPEEGTSLRWINQWMEDRQSIGRGQPRLNGAQTIGLRRCVVENLFLDNPLPNSLVDWHIHKRIAESDYSIGRVEETVVRSRIADTWLSYGNFCQMQSNAVSEIEDRKGVFIQLGLHVLLLTVPVFVVAREVPVVQDAARADSTAWRLSPLYFLARYVFIAARIRMCLDRLVHGQRY